MPASWTLRTCGLSVIINDCLVRLHIPTQPSAQQDIVKCIRERPVQASNQNTGHAHVALILRAAIPGFWLIFSTEECGRASDPTAHCLRRYCRPRFRMAARLPDHIPPTIVDCQPHSMAAVALPFPTNRQHDDLPSYYTPRQCSVAFHSTFRGRSYGPSK